MYLSIDPPKRLDLLAEALQRAVEHRLHRLGVRPLGDRGVAGEVGEQHRDLAALLGRRLGRRRRRRASAPRPLRRARGAVDRRSRTRCRTSPRPGPRPAARAAALERRAAGHAEPGPLGVLGPAASAGTPSPTRVRSCRTQPVAARCERLRLRSSATGIYSIGMSSTARAAARRAGGLAAASPGSRRSAPCIVSSASRWIAFELLAQLGRRGRAHDLGAAADRAPLEAACSSLAPSRARRAGPLAGSSPRRVAGPVAPRLSVALPEALGAGGGSGPGPSGPVAGSDPLGLGSSWLGHPRS